MDFLE